MNRIQTTQPIRTKEKEMSTGLRNHPVGSPVLVFRTKKQGWDVTHVFVQVDGETEIVQTQAGRRIFRTTCVKTWVKSAMKRAEEFLGDKNIIEIDMQRIKEDKVSTSEVSDDAMITTENWTIQKRTDHAAKVKKSLEFSQSRNEELTVLVDDGTFLPVNEKKYPRERVISAPGLYTS